MSQESGFTARTVTEERRGDVPLFAHPEWTRFEWLVQGITARDAGNFASFGDQDANSVQTQWRTLRENTGMVRSVLGRQVHGANVLSHETFANGTLFADNADGHTTRVIGTLLAVSIADCVPVFIVDERARMVGALHAGWRGVAAGILARGVKCMASHASALHVHLGPGICGECYEVGPEVHTALGFAAPETNTNIDIRAVLAAQALKVGVPEGNITVSTYCTRCNDSPFFSHRAGHAERQVGVIGIRGH